MGQLEELLQNTETDKALHEAYFMKSEMIRFLLVENLALKTILHEKGLFTAKEFKVCQERAAEILDAKVRQQLEEWKKLQTGFVTPQTTDLPHPVDAGSLS